jgi:hypothetical protein
MVDHFISNTREVLFNTIKKVEQCRSLFLLNPESDFTRKRKIDFETFIKMTLSMGGSSLKKELLDYFDFSADTPGVSAYNQQRAKVLPEAFEFLFHEFTTSVNPNKLFNGYRLLACDGSNLTIPTNSNDMETFVSRCNQFECGVNRLHLNAFYDLMNRIYVDALIQTAASKNEFRACVQMIDRSNIGEKVILTADRGYENYNIFAHAEKKGWKFAIRVKDIDSIGILSGLSISEKGAFDKNISLTLTRSHSKANRMPNYKFMPTCQKFDYMPVESKTDYLISFRVVRFLIAENTYETIITNLDRDEFPPDIMKKIYHLRWGIETSFRELKYAIGLTNFHAKKVAYIKQEIFARLVLYNFCETITTKVVVKQATKSKVYQVNYTLAIYICREYLKNVRTLGPPDIELLIQKNTLPVRPGRKDPRKVKTQKLVSFLYRVA